MSLRVGALSVAIAALGPRPAKRAGGLASGLLRYVPNRRRRGAAALDLPDTGPASTWMRQLNSTDDETKDGVDRDVRGVTVAVRVQMDDAESAVASRFVLGFRSDVGATLRILGSPAGVALPGHRLLFDAAFICRPLPASQSGSFRLGAGCRDDGATARRTFRSRLRVGRLMADDSIGRV